MESFGLLSHKIGRGCRLRSRGFMLPKHALYWTELNPEILVPVIGFEPTRGQAPRVLSALRHTIAYTGINFGSSNPI